MSAKTCVIRAYLLYEFKLDSNAADASRKICMSFGEDTVKEHTHTRLFKKRSSWDGSLENSLRSG